MLGLGPTKDVTVALGKAAPRASSSRALAAETLALVTVARPCESAFDMTSASESPVDFSASDGREFMSRTIATMHAAPWEKNRRWQRMGMNLWDLRLAR